MKSEAIDRLVIEQAARLVVRVALAALVLFIFGCTWQTKGTYEAEGDIPMLGDAAEEDAAAPATGE